MTRPTVLDDLLEELSSADVWRVHDIHALSFPGVRDEHVAMARMQTYAQLPPSHPAQQGIIHTAVSLHDARPLGTFCYAVKIDDTEQNIFIPYSFAVAQRRRIDEDDGA